MNRDDLAASTLAVHVGREQRLPGAQVGAPLVLTSTYVADGPVNYARSGNPTWTAFEDAVGALEGGRALAFASGLAAVDAVLSLVPVGGLVVAPREGYNGTVATLTDQAASGALHVRWLEDVTDTTAVTAALRGADLLWLESPTNPLLDVADLPVILHDARAHGILTVVDNTFATPLRQQPLALGADVVVASATKYLAGHSDLLLGVCVTGDDAVRERLHRHRTIRGATPGPFETWLALRGLRTFPLRFERAEASAATLAGRLSRHPGVTRVRYPGFGAIVSIETVGGACGAEQVATTTRLWLHSTSLGGVESQLERRRRQPGEPERVPVDLLRLSVGIEDVEDLWRDLAVALESLVI